MTIWDHYILEVRNEPGVKTEAADAPTPKPAQASQPTETTEEMEVAATPTPKPFQASHHT